MPKMSEQISETKIKQVFLISLLLALVSLIVYNLSMFIPSLLGALTLYIVCRKLNFYLIEERGWNSAWSALSIIIICLLVLIIPLYLIGDLIIQKIGDSREYMDKFSEFLDKIHGFIIRETDIDILSKSNLDRLKETAAKLSSSALSGTFNTLTIVASMFFMLYFMLNKPRYFEKIVTSAMPLKKSNINLIGDKFRKLVIANAVGIPVVAVGQGIVASVGYLICGAPSPILLFVLTAIASMIPIVGAAIVYVPVCLFMIAEGDTAWAIGLLIYCLVVVGVTDNVLRFTLLKKLEDIHPLNTVFGIIMGMNLFGFMGLVFGPILVSMTVLLFQIYKNEFGEDPSNELIMPHETEAHDDKIDLSI